MRIFYTWDLSDPSRFHHEPIDGTYFDWLFSRLAGTGITFLFRCNLAGRTYYHSELMKPMDESAINSSNPQALEMWRTVTRVLEVCNPLAEAVRAARKYDVPIWAWWNWQEFQCVRRGWLELIDPTWYENPRKYWCTRDGSRFYHGSGGTRAFDGTGRGIIGLRRRRPLFVLSITLVAGLLANSWLVGTFRAVRI